LILVDTNVISQLMRAQAPQIVLEWIKANERDILLSTVTLGEMSVGVSRLPDGRKKEDLRYLFDCLIDRFANQFVVYGMREAEIYGQVMAHAFDLGAPMSIPDGMIAASAQVLRLPLATRNTKDFQTTGLTLINPWLPVAE
jgi:toxin FitB